MFQTYVFKGTEGTKGNENQGGGGKVGMESKLVSVILYTVQINCL
jgi:hypothetical protein